MVPCDSSHRAPPFNQRTIRCLSARKALVGEARGAVGQPDNAAVGEAVLLDEVLHDAVVAVRVDAQVRVSRGGEIDDRRKDPMVLRVARDAVDDTVGLVGEPGAVDIIVRWLRGGKKGEVGTEATVFNDKTPTACDVA